MASNRCVDAHKQASISTKTNWHENRVFQLDDLIGDIKEDSK